jgi:hypothetical protein
LACKLFPKWQSDFRVGHIHVIASNALLQSLPARDMTQLFHRQAIIGRDLYFSAVFGVDKSC